MRATCSDPFDWIRLGDHAPVQGHRFRQDRYCSGSCCTRLTAARRGDHTPAHARREGLRMPQVTLTVNGKQHTVEVENRTLLVELLREKLGLTGTHVCCDTSQCGACVVHVDGISAKSCTMLALQADGTSVLTIEDLAAADRTLHPMQEMFREHYALQR